MGVSKLTQMAGKENQELECHLLVTIAEAEDEEGESLYPHFFVVIRALMDFIWCAQMCEHTDISLAAMKNDLAAFHALKNVFIENSAHCNQEYRKTW